MKIDPFVILLFLSIFVAYIYPPLGSGTGTFSLSTAAHYGVSLIFFFYGLRLNWEKIAQGLSNYRLHVVVHLSTFVLFPLLVLPLALHFSPPGEPDWLWIGIFFLATLPSTVSSSVVMVNMARGNVPAAIFDASISSLLGVFITPLWMQFFISSQTSGKDLSSVVFSLIVQVILPVLLGIALHRQMGAFSQRHDKTLRKFDQSVILLIVYTSFCHSFQDKMFSAISLQTLALLSAGMVGLFFVVYFIVALWCRILRFNREDTITALFCGSKKSLVHGVVMSQVLLPNAKLAGILILPTMIYHALQLIIVSVIASRFAKDGTE
ncbi:MAG: bile acid:sodium symporter family protein [Planctomycetia bacterium]|nr:bile acid:sodium symporter family protein [Planctomycetia bacterium]